MIKKLTVTGSFIHVPNDIVEEHITKEVKRFIVANDDELENILKEVIIDTLGEEYYIFNLANKKGWEPYKMVKYLEYLTKLNPTASAIILLKEIAIDFDSKYEDNIKNSKEIWTISMLNGSVEKVNKNKIKSYKNFPAFRSKEEAMKAHTILSKRLRKMFRGCEK